MKVRGSHKFNLIKIYIWPIKKIQLKILKLGKDQNSDIKFNWKLYDGSGKLMDNNDYTFSPGKAMTELKDR